MPVYEYEPDDDRLCVICDGRFSAVQSLDEAPLKLCPYCGLEVHRVISRASFKIDKGITMDKRADRGFTTWKRTGEGRWEKVSGEGVDAIVGDPADIQAVKEEKEGPRKVIDLDQES